LVNAKKYAIFLLLKPGRVERPVPDFWGIFADVFSLCANPGFYHSGT
jgi:hypothetical protein